MKHILSFFLIFISFVLLGKTSSIDSLKLLISNNNNPEKEVILLNSIAKICFEGSVDSSDFYVKKAIVLADSLNYITGLIDAHNFQAKIYIFSSKLEEARSQIRIVDSLIAINSTPIQNGEVLLRKGELDLIEGNYNNALSTLANAEEIFEQEKSYSLLIETNLQISRVYLRLDSLDGAENTFKNILAINEKHQNEKELRIKMKSNIASVHLNRENYFKAINSYEELLTEYENNINTVEDSILVNVILNNIGLIYLRLKDFDESRRYFLQAFELQDKKNPSHKLAIINKNIGESYLGAHKYDTAHEYYLKAYEVSLQLNDPFEIARSLYYLGKSNFNLEQYDTCEKYLLEALEAFQVLGTPKEISLVKSELAKLEYHNKNYKKSLDYALDANRKAIQTGYKSIELRTAKLVAELYELEENHEQALSYYKRYNELLVEKQDPTMLRQIFTHQIEMEYQRKTEQEAIIQEAAQKNRRNLIVSAIVFFILLSLFAWNRYQAINQKNKLITKQSQKLQELNTTKDKLFSIIGHDLRGPIRGLETVLEMFLARDLSEQEFLDLAKDLKKNTSSIYQILENLLHWSNIQMQGKVYTETIQLDIRQQVGLVINFIQEVAKAKQVQIYNNIQAPIEVISDPNHINLVIRNLLSNAVKFTHQNGEIHILATKTDNEAIISIQDNGIGISQEQIVHLFDKDRTISTWGTANEKGIGLGLNLCKEMIEKNGGRIWVESEPLKGSTFSFSLPLAN